MLYSIKITREGLLVEGQQQDRCTTGSVLWPLYELLDGFVRLCDPLRMRMTLSENQNWQERPNYPTVMLARISEIRKSSLPPSGVTRSATCMVIFLLSYKIITIP